MSDELEKILQQSIVLKCKCGQNREARVLSVLLNCIFCHKCEEEILIDKKTQEELEKKIPLHTALILDAISDEASKKTNTRDVIVKVNSALELWIRKKIKSYLGKEGVDESLTGFILENARLFEQLSKLLKVLGFKTPEKIAEELGQLRSLRKNVVHFGYRPTFEEAKWAQDIVLKMVSGTKEPPPNLGKLLVKTGMGKYKSLADAFSEAQKSEEQQ